MVASKCSRNQNVAEKYTKVQPLKIHFLPNAPRVQIYTYAGNFKGFGNIPESHFVKAFSALPSHF